MDRALLATLVADLEADRVTGSALAPRLCQACVPLLGVSGAGITLIIDGEPRSSLGASDARVGVIEDLQFTLGEGPCVDAYHARRPVLEPDLARRSDRWSAFAGPAVAAGIRAVFGFPLQLGATRVGALDLYCDEAGELGPERLADALEVADLVTRTILALQAGAGPDGLAAEIDDAQAFRAVVHQASGMLAARHDISVGEGLARLRAYAFASERPINDVAYEVVTGELHLD